MNAGAQNLELPEDPVPLLQKAEAALRAGNLAEARRLAQEAANRTPQDPRPYLTGSLIEFSDGKTDLAIELCSYSLRIAPTTGAFINLSRLYGAADRGEEQLAAARLATAFAPESPLAWTRKGQAYDDLSIINLAQESYERALSLDADFVPALEALTRSYLGQGQIAEASATLDRLRQAAPAYHPAFALQGRLLRARNDLQGAILAYEAALEGATGLVTVHRDVAEAYVLAGSPARAEEHYRIALEARPEDESTLFGLGTLLRNQGEMEEARAVLQRYQAARKARDERERLMEGRTADSPWIVWQKLVEGTADPDLESLREKVAENPRDPVPHLVLASALVLQGSPVESLPHVRQAEFYGPLHSPGFTNLGSALNKAGMTVPSRRAWMKALYADPGNEAARLSLLATEFQLAANSVLHTATEARTPLQEELLQASLLWLGRERDQARERLAELAEEHPGDPLLQMHLALALTSVPDWERAEEAFRKAIDAGTFQDVWMPEFFRALCLANLDQVRDGYEAWRKLGVDVNLHVAPPDVSSPTH